MMHDFAPDVGSEVLPFHLKIHRITEPPQITSDLSVEHQRNPGFIDGVLPNAHSFHGFPATVPGGDPLDPVDSG